MMSLCLASVGVWVALVAPALLAQCAGTGGVPAPDVGSHVYVVMAYNRPRAVAGAVAALAAAGACSARLTDGPRGPPPGGGAPQWPCVLVTQSAPSAAAPIVGEVRAAAAAAAVDAGWPVWALGHRTTLTAAEDVGAYGSKAESSRNLLHGMRAGFAAMAAALAPRPHFVVMLEDDVKIGCDTLEFFAFARLGLAVLGGEAEAPTEARALDAWPAPVVSAVASAGAGWEMAGLATSAAWLRPGLLCGHLDWHDPSGAAGVRAMEAAGFARSVFGWPWGPRGLFKTFAWMASEHGAALVEAAAADAAGAGGVPSPACEFCLPHCYDHLIEWAARGRRVLVAAVPRVSQTSVRGMSCPDPEDPACMYQAGNVEPAMYTGACVRREEFVVVPLEAVAWTPWLPGPSVNAAASRWVAGHGGRVLAWLLLVTREPFVRAGVGAVAALAVAVGCAALWWLRRRGSDGPPLPFTVLGAVVCGGAGAGARKSD